MTNCCEAFVKSDNTLRVAPIERSREEDLRWHALNDQARWILEPELPVRAWVSYQTTSSGFHGLQA